MTENQESELDRLERDIREYFHDNPAALERDRQDAIKFEAEGHPRLFAGSVVPSHRESVFVENARRKIAESEFPNLGIDPIGYRLEVLAGIRRVRGGDMLPVEERAAAAAAYAKAREPQPKGKTIGEQLDELKARLDALEAK
jgi:hypothetical protein